MVFARKWCCCEIFEGGEVGSEKMEIVGAVEARAVQVSDLLFSSDVVAAFSGARNCGGADLFEGGTVMKIVVLPWMHDAISGVVVADLAGAS